jgi:WD40 repeat protein
VTSLSFSTDNKWLATETTGRCDRYEGLVSLNKTRIWDLQTGAEVGWVSRDEPQCHKNPKSLQASSGGRTDLASQVGAWQQAKDVTKKEKDEASSRDGQWTASISSGKVTLLATRTTGKGLEITQERVNWIDFSPDGHWLATASDDGTVRLWPLWTDGIVKEACARLPHNLSREDRGKFLGDPNFSDTCPDLPTPEKKE